MIVSGRACRLGNGGVPASRQEASVAAVALLGRAVLGVLMTMVVDSSMVERER